MDPSPGSCKGITPGRAPRIISRSAAGQMTAVHATTPLPPVNAADRLALIGGTNGDVTHGFASPGRATRWAGLRPGTNSPSLSWAEGDWERCHVLAAHRSRNFEQTQTLQVRP